MIENHIGNTDSTQYVQTERVGAKVAFSRFACVFHYYLHIFTIYFPKVLLLS